MMAGVECLTNFQKLPERGYPLLKLPDDFCPLLKLKMARSSRSHTRVFDANVTKEKKKSKEGDNVVEEALADIPSLPELKRIYYELMIR